jgi:hypothetical protein
MRFICPHGVFRRGYLWGPFVVQIGRLSICIALLAWSFVTSAIAQEKELLVIHERFRTSVTEWFDSKPHLESPLVRRIKGTSFPGGNGFTFEGIQIELPLVDPTGQTAIEGLLDITLVSFEDAESSEKSQTHDRPPVARIEYRDTRGWRRLTANSSGSFIEGFWKEHRATANLRGFGGEAWVGLERYGWGAGLMDLLLNFLRKAENPDFEFVPPADLRIPWKDPGEMGYTTWGDGTWRSQTPDIDDVRTQNLIKGGREVNRVDMDLVRRLSGERSTSSWQKWWWMGVGLLILVILAVCYLKRALPTKPGDNGSAA